MVYSNWELIQRRAIRKIVHQIYGLADKGKLTAHRLAELLLFLKVNER